MDSAKEKVPGIEYGDSGDVHNKAVLLTNVAVVVVDPNLHW